MHLKWEISDTEITKWRDFIEKHRDRVFVRDRHALNIDRQNIDLSRKALWRIHVGCQVTTQQKSGPDSVVGKFLESDSPALSYKKCVTHESLKELIESELVKHRLRRSSVIAQNLEANLSYLEDGNWGSFEAALKTIAEETTLEKERCVADYIARVFKGLGPKQSRNFIQWAGLSRYEIPVDSRLLRKMKAFGCSFTPSSGALSDIKVYLLVQSGLQQLSQELGVYPCILDACVFSSFDS